MSTLRIVHVIEAAGGGTGRHVLELTRELAGRGHEVHVLFSPTRAEPFFVDGLRACRDVRLVPLPMRRGPHPGDLGVLWRLRRYLRSIGGADIVHGHSSKGGAIACLGRLAGPSARRVYTPHAFRTMDPTLSFPARLLFGWMERFVVAVGCDALVAVSRDEYDHARRQGIDGERMTVIRNAIPQVAAPGRDLVRDELGLGADDVCVGFVGRYVHQKAPERMVEAMARVFERHPDSRLVMLGDGELEPMVHQRARQLSAANRIGFVRDRAGAATMPAFDVFVMPSRYEAMPYVLLEALFAGLPIVATDVGGVSEVVDDGCNGFVVPNGDIEQLSERIGRLVADPALRASMREAALERAAAFSPERMVERTLEVYRGGR